MIGIKGSFNVILYSTVKAESLNTELQMSREEITAQVRFQTLQFIVIQWAYVFIDGKSTIDDVLWACSIVAHIFLQM